MKNNAASEFGITARRSLWFRLSKWSSDPATVFIALALITVLTVSSYLYLHFRINPESENFICSYTDSLGNGDECLIIRDGNDALKVNFIRTGLLSSFSGEAIDAVQSEVEAFTTVNRPILVRQRLDFLRSVANLESQLVADYFEAEVHRSNCIPPGRRTQEPNLSPDEPGATISLCDPGKIALLDHPLPDFPSLVFIAGDLTPATATNSALEIIGTSRLQPVLDMLNYLCYGNESVMEPGAESNRPPPCTVTQLQRYHERIRFELGRLAEIEKDELNNWLAAKNISSNLQSDLDLEWLWIDDSGWVWELAFWCWFGVLTNTGFAIISALKKPNYSEEGFKPDFVLFMFPKMLFAPFIAIVVASFILAGLTDFNLSLANAPVFLIFAFFSGFFSERFAEIVRSFFAIFSKRITPSEQKFEQQKRWQKIDFTADLASAESLSEMTPILSRKARQTARRELASGLVQ